MVRKDRMELLASQFVDIWDEKLVLVSVFTNEVYIISPDNHCVLDIIKVLNVNDEEMQFRGFCCYGDKLFLAPYNACYFVVIDLKTKKEVLIGKDLTESRKNAKHKYYRVIRTGSEAFVFGEAFHEVISVDLNNFTCHKICDYENSIYWTSAFGIYNDLLYVPSRTKDVIICINIESKKICLKKVVGPSGGKGFLDIYSDDDFFHLFDENGNEYIWDSKNSCLIKCDMTDKEMFTSRQCVKYLDRVFRIALRYDGVFCRRNNGDFELVDGQIEHQKIANNLSRFQEGVIDGKYYYFQNRLGILYRINMEDIYVEKVFISVDNELIEQRTDFLSNCLFANVVREGDMFDIYDYVNFLKR